MRVERIDTRSFDFGKRNNPNPNPNFSNNKKNKDNKGSSSFKEQLNKSINKFK